MDIEVIFITRSRTRPSSKGLEFLRGQVTGRAYLWNQRTSSIECVGDLEAESSASVDVQRVKIGGSMIVATGDGDIGELSVDLDRQLERAIAVGLKAAR